MFRKSKPIYIILLKPSKILTISLFFSIIKVGLKQKINYGLNHRNEVLVKMEMWQGKQFSITDPKDVNTVIYQVSKTEKEMAKSAPKLTVERLDFIEELRGENKRKTFFIDKQLKEDEVLVILSFAKEKVIINNGILQDNQIKVLKKPTPFKFKSIYSEKELEYTNVDYTPNLKRPIAIIDPETTEEVKPVLYFDEKTNEVKGKCKLKPYKSYFAFEVRQENDEYNIVGGNPVIS